MTSTEQPKAPFVQTVCEADIDWIFCVELNSNSQFRNWFGTAIFGVESAVHEGAWRSVCESALGESDLVWLFRGTDGHSRMALIENKIRASAQPDQYERYLKRGQQGVEKKTCQEFRIVLISPEGYRSDESDKYQPHISYESVRDWFKSRGGERTDFLASIFQAAIDKFHRSGIQECNVSQEMTAFRQQYSTYCGEVFGDQCHDIEWDRPRDAWWGDTWFLFRKGLLGKEVYINHKSPAGFVDLTFPNTDATRLKTIAAIPAAGMTIHQTYKSAAIRLNVPKIGQFSDFNQERGKVAEGLVAVRKLLDFYARERDRLQNALINEHADVASVVPVTRDPNQP